MAFWTVYWRFVMISALPAVTAKHACSEDGDRRCYQASSVALLQSSVTVLGYSPSTTALKSDAMLEGFHMAHSKMHAKLANASLAYSIHDLSWLHVPKAGTSFVATLWNYACGQRGLPLDLNVDVAASYQCSQCYDFALMQRYPREMYCEEGVLSKSWQTQHLPITLSHVQQRQNTVGMFRRPNQRVISAFHDSYHASGFTQTTMDNLRSACPEGRSTPACFAKYPGIAGCMTRMLTGGMCAEDPYAAVLVGKAKSDTRTKDAGVALRAMSFVGITEEWDESVCLFHLMFGGRMDPAELKDVHRGPGHLHEYDESVMDGFVDPDDEKTYAAAQARFHDLKEAYVGLNSSACHRYYEERGIPIPEVAAEMLASGDAKAQGSACAAAGLECGRLGDQRDCGVCPLKRLEAAFPRSGDLTAVCSDKGKCTLQGGNESHEAEGRIVFAWYPDKIKLLSLAK